MTDTERLSWLLTELGSRFPGMPPGGNIEAGFVAAIDYERALCRKAIALAQVALHDWSVCTAPHEYTQDEFDSTRTRLNAGTLYYIAHTQTLLDEAKNAN